MTEFSRSGHFRVDADGTRFWVSPHVVDHQHYSLTVVGKDYFVDENKFLLKEICKHCYQTIYYAYLNKDKNGKKAAVETRRRKLRQIEEKQRLRQAKEER